MRHRKRKEKLGRTSAHREALISNLLVSLIKSGKIETTEVKAKVLKRYFDRLVSLASRGDNASIRIVISWLRDKEAFKLLMRSIVPRMRDRKGGYSRVIKAGYRKGDGAPVAVVEIVS